MSARKNVSEWQKQMEPGMQVIGVALDKIRDSPCAGVGIGCENGADFT